jgi:hypothetical protein
MPIALILGKHRVNEIGHFVWGKSFLLTGKGV